MAAYSNILFPAGFPIKLYAQDAAQLSRYTIQVTQVSKNMEVELVTSSCKILPSLSLDYIPCHTLSTYVILGEWCIFLRAES